jgi:hypothetical protein
MGNDIRKGGTLNSLLNDNQGMDFDQIKKLLDIIRSNDDDD